MRGDPLMLMTFAVYVPADYSRAAFDHKQLDYRLHRMPVETWGRREYVMAAVTAHNDVIRRLAAEHREVLFVDQDAMMERSSRNFDDPFHLTIDGSVAFAGHIVGALRLQTSSDDRDAHDARGAGTATACDVCARGGRPRPPRLVRRDAGG